MDPMLISIIVFLIVYAAITFELVNKAVAAFSGVSILVLLNIISPHIPHFSGEHSGSHHDIPYAIMLIDYETIMLLFGFGEKVYLFSKPLQLFFWALFNKEATFTSVIKVWEPIISPVMRSGFWFVSEFYNCLCGPLTFLLINIFAI